MRALVTRQADQRIITLCKAEKECIVMLIVDNGRKSAAVQFHGEIVCKPMFLMNLHCVNIPCTSWVDE